jgi:pimeloyl-ACP methyl ester carboxylesterase
MQAISADGRTVAAVSEGAGPALLVVHPGGSDAGSWAAVAARLVGEFRVVRIQRRVYAAGAEIALPHSVAVEAADVLAVAELLDAPVLAVGHSSGAVAVLEAALARPSAFAGVVAYEPPMPTRELVCGEAAVRARAAVDAGDLLGAMRIHLRDIVRLPPEVTDVVVADRRASAALTAYAAAQIADDEAIDALGVGIGRYSALRLPVTLIEGYQSPVHLRERVADLAAVLPDARTVVLAGQGHLAHTAAPGVLADAVREAAKRILGT